MKSKIKHNETNAFDIRTEDTAEMYSNSFIHTFKM